MARRGDGLYQRGKTWWLDFTHRGQRHVARLGRGITKTVARELAQRTRERILLDEERQRTAPHDVPQIALTGMRLRRARSPLVYLFVSAGHVKYVGASRHGLSRPLGAYHHRLKDVVPGPDDALVHFAVPTWAMATHLERELIGALRPEWNGTQNGEER